MKKYLVLCAGLCAFMAFTSCKSSESAYKKAYNPEKWNLKNYFYQNYGYIHKNLYK